jgi:uncharacterized NAD-dependent epimerase/dehydratase family protein
MKQRREPAGLPVTWKRARDTDGASDEPADVFFITGTDTGVGKTFVASA